MILDVYQEKPQIKDAMAKDQQETPADTKLWEKIKRFSSKHKTKIVLGILALGLLDFAIYCAVAPPEKIGWTGFKRDEEITSARKTGVNGVEETTTTKEVSGKTLWDWMSLILAPVTLTGLGFWFQSSQEKARTEREATEKRQAAAREKADKKQAETNQREQALESYLDRISDILLSQQLLSLDLNDPKEKAKLDTSLDIIRARTLVILQRLNIEKDITDGERKMSVLLFLYDAELIGKPEQAEKSESNKPDAEVVQTHKRPLSLEGADFSGTTLWGAVLRNAELIGVNLKGSKLIRSDLSNANLWNTDLSNADLTNANLRSTNFTSTNLMGANLTSAALTSAVLISANLKDAKLIKSNLINANLTFADLTSAILTNANLKDAALTDADLIYADLTDADLSGASLIKSNLSTAKNLTEAQLAQAKLCRTKLPSGIGLDPNRDCRELGLLDLPDED